MSQTRDTTFAELFGYPHLQREHLKQTPPDSGVKLSADIDRSEAWCDDCGNRVTVGDKEYGHARDCEHSCWESGQ